MAKKEVEIMTQEQDTKRDRLNAYVEPETTKLIAKIQQELKRYVRS